jgi:hypothetical protein
MLFFFIVMFTLFHFDITSLRLSVLLQPRSDYLYSNEKRIHWSSGFSSETAPGSFLCRKSQSSRDNRIMNLIFRSLSCALYGEAFCSQENTNDMCPLSHSFIL